MSSTAVFVSVWHMLSPKPRTCATCASCNYLQCWVWLLTVCAYAARQMRTQEHIALKIGRCHAAAAARTHARTHARTCTRTRMQPRARAHTHRRTHSHARAHTHTHAHGYGHRHRHIEIGTHRDTQGHRETERQNRHIRRDTRLAGRGGDVVGRLRLPSLVYWSPSGPPPFLCN